MRDGRFDLDGFEFGAGTEVRVKSFDRGTRVVRDQDAPVPAGDGLLMGRDQEDGTEWTFDLIVKGGGGAATFDLVEQMEAAWKRPHRPGELSVLRYSLPGRERRVYGRPRRFADAVSAVKQGWHWDHYSILATFRLADPLTYADEAHMLDLGLMPNIRSGFTLPAVLPLTLGGADGRRDSEVIVEGRAGVPFTLTFHGPATGTSSGWWAEGPGWRIDLDASLAWDQSATIDTRTHTVTRSDGLSLAGRARGRFLNARLQPGRQDIAWGCDDPTNTASLSLIHRPGYHSL